MAGGVVESDEREVSLLDEPLFVETLQDLLQELQAHEGDPDEIAEVQAQLDFFLGR